MANKSYNSGTAKKWAVFLGIVVLVAIIVVVVILAIPPNTYNAVETLNRTSATSYLTSKSEQEEFNAFKTKIASGKNSIDNYGQELNDVEKIAQSIDLILDFHNDYLVFAKDNKNLKNNYKAIKEGLQDAKNSQKELASLISKTNELSDSSTSYLKGAMVDYREEFVDYLKACTRAIEGLENAYSGSLGNVTFNNQASSLILNTINDYLQVITEKFETLVKQDVKSFKMTDYTDLYQELGLQTKVEFFNAFTNKNLNSNDIELFYFEDALQEKYSKLIEFFTVYQEPNSLSLIESMKVVEGSSSITKTYEGELDASLYELVCEFLKGGN